MSEYSIGIVGEYGVGLWTRGKEYEGQCLSVMVPGDVVMFVFRVNSLGSRIVSPCSWAGLVCLEGVHRVVDVPIGSHRDAVSIQYLDCIQRQLQLHS